MQEESKIRKVLLSEASYVIASLTIVFGVFNFFLNPVHEVKEDIGLIQKDIEVITTNHLTHIEKDIQYLKECQEKNVEEQQSLREFIYENINKVN